MNYSNMIDHTLLKPEATQPMIQKLIDEAKQYQFAAVCVNPCWISFAHQQLKDTNIKVAVVVGFPLGANTTEVKAFETANAVENGADEIDMVINIGALKEGKLELVEQDIAAVVTAAKGKTVKVILETCLLNDEEIVQGCLASKQAKAHFVKTSTGFNTAGATIEAVTLMKQTVKEELEVKAAGGVRSFDDLKAMVEAGATRIGTSSGPQLLGNKEITSDY